MSAVFVTLFGTYVLIQCGINVFVSRVHLLVKLILSQARKFPFEVLGEKFIMNLFPNDMSIII